MFIEYRPVVGYEGYRVGSDGSVWSRRVAGKRWGDFSTTWRRLNIWLNKGGYPCVSMKADKGSTHPDLRRVHRLVLEAFAGPAPPGMECLHLDNNRANSAIDNLKWGTRKENMEQMVASGTSAKGIKNHKAKLTDDNIIAIRKLVLSGKTHKEIAREFGVVRSVISLISSRKIWKHVP